MNTPLALLLVSGSVAVAARWVWRRTRAPHRPVGDALVTTVEWFPADDVGRLRGLAVPLGAPLRAPLTDRPCVGYELRISEHRNDETIELVHEVRWAPFLLDDGTGRALIDPSVAPVTWLVGAIVTQSGLADDATPAERALLARYRQAAEAGGFNRSLTYVERAITVGELVSVRGHGVREADPAPAAASLTRGAPPTRLRLVTTPATPLAISTVPADLTD